MKPCAQPSWYPLVHVLTAVTTVIHNATLHAHVRKQLFYLHMQSFTKYPVSEKVSNITWHVPKHEFVSVSAICNIFWCMNCWLSTIHAPQYITTIFSDVYISLIDAIDASSTKYRNWNNRTTSTKSLRNPRQIWEWTNHKSNNILVFKNEAPLWFLI
jgi:hypothetical protein